ncbi:hypothetical protein COCON_G00125360 [Conger conger]|uniref:Anillin n=1 Tax=Conger conger TaxID=82655 RepID=A0A9Q1DCW2_CONCO|nr:hypothetical protein COCON_G00125360 [Conger conger]
MDPFTEKLLERTRARRENLQKKMADRPTPAGRQTAKRAREPLAETNGPGAGSSAGSSPGPGWCRTAVSPARPALTSRGRCARGADRSLSRGSVTPPLPHYVSGSARLPQTADGNKPSPSKRRCSSENDRPVAGAENREPPVAMPIEPLTDKKPPIGPGSLRSASSLERQMDRREAGPAPSGMKSRLQRLAEQRHHWDNEAPSDGAQDSPPAPLSPVQAHRQEAVAADPTPVSTETPVGRRGRLANLAAVIGSWDDDLAPAGRHNAQGQPGTVCSSSLSSAVPTAKPSSANRPQAQARPTHPSTSAASPSLQQVPQSPVKSGRVGLPEPRCAPSATRPPLSVTPAATATATPLQKGGAATPGVKSFLERFGERCQERSSGKGSPGPADASPAVAPGNRLLQERLRHAPVVTATADLALKQKQEREKELAQIRGRFQKGNVWKSSDRDAAKEQQSVEIKTVQSPVEEEPTAPPVDTRSTASEPSPKEEPQALEREEFPMEKRVEESSDDDEEREVHAAGEVVREIEMNVDGQNSSDVIDQLFEGVLEESKERREEEEEEEEEDDDDEDQDPLNISSMSLLTPLAETVAAVVKSPEIKLMTSTPAGSFCESSPSDSASRPSRFQRARVLHALQDQGGSEEPNLPYSIDAYRSTRIKEAEALMKVLSNEMNMQQTVIHQASQALNCCTDQEHGKGSQVEAEAERLLLIATERRSALKAELDRLKGEGPAGQRKGSAPSRAQDDDGVSASKGSVTLQELRLPLKADFICSAANKPETANYYFFIMIRAGAENTVATPLASTRSALSGDALSFSTMFSLPEVSSDFEIDVEVYCLVQKRELCSDKKKKANKSKILWRHVHQVHEACFSAITPKRLLTSITKSGLQTPVVASPGGPNAVRTSNFTLLGSHKLSLASIGKNKFPLEKVPFLCPLEGHVYLRLQCEVGSCIEDRGFLTMFEDVSGFGAWHRRWCVLSGYCISYWTYPNDEKCKNPIGRINLANCTSRKVEPANREFCARPNTFELITVRPQREDDRETLVSHCKNTMCVTKNWLSADTKAERNLWMQKLNQILLDLRMWQPDSCYRPL